MDGTDTSEYYVIVDIRTLQFMRGGYASESIVNADIYMTEQKAREEIECYDEPEFFEVYKVEQEIIRNFKLLPKTPNINLTGKM